MRVLIIGGTGLISTAITRELVRRAEQVTVYNRGRREAAAPAGAALLRGDRTDHAAFEAQMTDHAAFEAQMAEAGPFDCVIDMVGYAAGDAESAARAFRGRVGQFIFCSTVDVYRKPATRYPYTEDEPYGGLNTYSRDKVRCEETLRRASEEGAFPLTIIRPAATYGEGRGPVHTFGGRTSYLDRLRKGKPIVVHGDGSSLWVACHRDDVARAFVAAVGNARTYGRAYHVAGEEWLTWDDYHRQVAAALGAPEPRLVHIPTDLLGTVAPRRAAIAVENFQFNNIFDNSAARRDLDFRYTVPWLEGARRMARWLDDHGGIEDSDADDFEDRLIAAWERAGAGMAAGFSEDRA